MMDENSVIFLANGLAIAADTTIMFFVLIVTAVIGLIGLLAMCFRSLNTMYVYMGLLAAFVMLFQPWRVWTGTPPSPATDSEWESAQDVLDLIEFCTISLLLFTVGVVSATVYQVRQHVQLEESLRQLKSAVREARRE